MARPNPDWPGNSIEQPQVVTGGTFEAPASELQSLSLTMSPAMAHIVRSAIVTSDVPGPLMEEASTLIATLHLYSQGQLNG